MDVVNVFEVISRYSSTAFVAAWKKLLVTCMHWNQNNNKRPQSENCHTPLCSPWTISLSVASHTDSHPPAKQGFFWKSSYFEDFKHMMEVKVKLIYRSNLWNFHLNENFTAAHFFSDLGARGCQYELVHLLQTFYLIRGYLYWHISITVWREIHNSISSCDMQWPCKHKVLTF